MEESGQPQAGKPAKKKRFDKRKPGARRMGPKPRAHLTDKEAQFLTFYKACGKVKEAAIAFGITPAAAYHISEHPRAKEFLDKIDGEQIKLAAAFIGERFHLTASYWFQKIQQILEDPEMKEFWLDALRMLGEADGLLNRPANNKMPGLNFNFGQPFLAEGGEMATPQTPRLFLPPWRKAALEAKTLNATVELETSERSTAPVS